MWVINHYRLDKAKISTSDILHSLGLPLIPLP